MKKVIITGGTGFLGDWVIREFIQRDIEIIAIVRNKDAAMKLINLYKNIRTVICPMSEYSMLPSLVADRDVDVFYHFAWAGTSGPERADINLQLENVKATCEAVQAASEIGCRKFVNAGSIMEYETIKYVPNDGSMPGPGYIYSTAKQTADFMAKTLAVKVCLPYVTAIISNIYGVGEKSARFINTTIRKFLNNEKTSFTHGEQLYDFIYASDAAVAFYLIGVGGKAYTSYYIGNSIQYPLKEFIIKIKNSIDRKINLNFGEIQFQGPMMQYTEFDTSKLWREFHFQPEVTFESGIALTTQWIKSNELRVIE